MPRRLIFSQAKMAWLRKNHHRYPLHEISAYMGCCTDTLKRLLMRENLRQFSGERYQVSRAFIEQQSQWMRPCLRCGDRDPRPKGWYMCRVCRRRAGYTDELTKPEASYQKSSKPKDITMPKNGRGCQAKGSTYEREIAQYMCEQTGLTVSRAPLSGGGVVTQLSGGADLLGTPGLHIEAKRVEKLSFPTALAQAEGAARMTGSPDVPIIVSRRNRMRTGQSYVVLRLDDFLGFYNAWLQREGFTKPRATALAAE